jgi:hypothetical protein
MWSPGPARVGDDDEPTGLVTVPLFDGPLLVADLRAHGIEATAVESSNPATRVASDARIFVRRGDLESAQAIVARRGLDQTE